MVTQVAKIKIFLYLIAKYLNRLHKRFEVYLGMFLHHSLSFVFLKVLVKAKSTIASSSVCIRMNLSS